MRRGMMIVLSSPSGAGKSTLAKALLEWDAAIVPSVSMTTRAPRPSEVDGVHYRFVDAPAFERERERGGLLESAVVHGNLYGTPRLDVERALSAGKDVIFDIDWQGTLQLYDRARADIVSVFVLPPSATELHARLTRRAEDSEEVIARRLANAREEIRHWRSYDHVVVNENFDVAFERIRGIVERSRADRAQESRARAHAEALEASLGDLIRELDEGLSSLDAVSQGFDQRSPGV